MLLDEVLFHSRYIFIWILEDLLFHIHLQKGCMHASIGFNHKQRYTSSLDLLFYVFDYSTLFLDCLSWNSCEYCLNFFIGYIFFFRYIIWKIIIYMVHCLGRKKFKRERNKVFYYKNVFKKKQLNISEFYTKWCEVV